LYSLFNNFGRLVVEFEVDTRCRIECEILRGLAKCVWPKTNDRLIGKAVRKAFISAKRTRSNSTYYYQNVKRRNKKDDDIHEEGQFPIIFT
jgi:hypothetical protein